MRFIEVSDLRIGMRLARPIYSEKGVLLFERDSKLTKQAIESARNFGLLGVYILEPAEPLPPVSEEDLEFERFQIMSVFSIQAELEKIASTKKQTQMDSIVGKITRKYGHVNGKVNFYQNLRSRDDYICRHILNTAILCALITHTMNVMPEEQGQAVLAALVHEIGKTQVSKEMLFDHENAAENRERLYQVQLQGLDILEEAFPEGKTLKRICMPALRSQYDFSVYGKVDPNVRLSNVTKVLLVADRYDEMTAMDLQGNSESEIRAIWEFRDHPELYDVRVVDALLKSINILIPGVSVELSTGDKALVLVENAADVLRPLLLNFRDNSILDLSVKKNKDIRIVDIMKTLDNRYVMDMEAMQEAMAQAKLSS